MERLDVVAIHQVCERLYRAQFGVAKIATPEEIREFLSDSAKKEESHRFTTPFLMDEWDNVVDAWQLDSWGGLSRCQTTREEAASTHRAAIEVVDYI